MSAAKRIEEQSVEVSVMNHYGRETIKPECPISRLFAKLLRQKTLTRENIEVIKSLGYTVRIKEVIL